MFKLKLYEWSYKSTLMLATILVYQMMTEQTESFYQTFVLACLAYTISTVTEHFYKKSLFIEEGNINTIGVER